MKSPRIVIVEDEEQQRDLLVNYFRAQRFDVSEAASVTQGKAVVRDVQPDVILTDFNLLDGDGLDVLRAARDIDPDVAAVVLSAYGTVPMAVASMRLGAFDVLQKPVEPQVLVGVIARALQLRALTREHAALKRAVSQRELVEGVIGNSPAMVDVLNLVPRLAKSTATVLVTGESGTGKELIARMLHEQSPRHERPFVAVNCGALPDGLIESELFGHVRGAFTGAVRDHVGCFEAAGDGTLFLDEIGELSLALQSRLLRVLQEREITRVGEGTPRSVNARIVAATNRDVEAAVRAGTLRSDLYHRINVLRVHLPPLRVRGGDIGELAQQFVRDASLRQGRGDLRLSPEALDALSTYSFPGNVRELRNVIERVVLTAELPLIQLSDLPSKILVQSDDGLIRDDAPLDLGLAVEALERRLIRAALRRAGDVQTKAAMLLGIHERVLRYKRKKLGV